MAADGVMRPWEVSHGALIVVTPNCHHPPPDFGEHFHRCFVWSPDAISYSFAEGRPADPWPQGRPEGSLLWACDPEMIRIFAAGLVNEACVFFFLYSIFLLY